MDDWVEIYDFPRYAVNSLGQVKNQETGRIMALSVNQRGIVNVGMMGEHIQFKRAVDHLVADAHLGTPPSSSFDSLIHLDGDLLNCRADNLMWRPSWFRIAYHRQFEKPSLQVLVPVYVVDTDEVFQNSRELAVRYGLLEKEIALACDNFREVYPVGYSVRIHKE